MEKNSQYGPLAADKLYIDKTETLKKGIELFPSIYIEGAAASGKTTAVRLLVEKCPEVNAWILDMKNEMEAMESLDKIIKSWGNKEEAECWIVFENMHSELTERSVKNIAECIRRLPPRCHAILIGRDRPSEELLDLLWKGQMQLISQESLRFTEEEICMLVEHSDSCLEAGAILKQTGGWAGCVTLMIRLSENDPIDAKRSAEELRASYEIATYVEKYMIGSLSSEEKEIMRRAAVCPWLNEAMCSEVWQISWASDILQNLCRKGLLEYNKKKKRWKMAPLFRGWKVQETNAAFWKGLGNWHDQNGNIREALSCLKKSQDEGAYRACMLENYSIIPFLGIPYPEVMSWKGTDPRLCYLRGAYCYLRQNLEGVNLEIQNLMIDEEDDTVKREIYLNLTFLKPDLDLNHWIELLERYGREKEHLRLYNILGNSHTYLCGLRDLSQLFACSKREENRKARIWRERLGAEEWKCYQLARMDYYLETERKDAISVEDWELLLMQEDDKDHIQDSWQQRLAKLYLLCKLQRMTPEEEYGEQIDRLESSLRQEEYSVCVRNTEAVRSLYAPGRNKQERLARWLLESDQNTGISVREDNYNLLCCQAKAYLYLNQYKRSEKILRYLIPYLQFYRRYQFQAELLFQQAVIRWGEGLHGQALRNTIESFMVSGECRYVGFYTTYEKKGKEVLEEYVDWLSKNSPGGWHRKKKYNYGNVLRMPKEDYMEVVLRCARRRARSGPSIAEENIKEHLTMMETIILQDINRGLTNAEICEELNLKLPTVKSHIYNLYKKLGVSSRVQAILRGKEQGILD
ncbi:MAG: LuxR C-terminal-related transcriptional regulator [Anaerostipes sp.]|nr:LuxR C-terminal-related transcriptional regulator [Anaerostipes sp.]